LASVSICSAFSCLSDNCTMAFRLLSSSTRLIGQRGPKRSFSTSPLEGDAGTLATHVHHGMTVFLVGATPIVFLMPDSYTDGIPGKVFGGIVATTVAAHSWIGLNYVVTDYVPKISKALVGPARMVNFGIGAITLLGLGKIAVNDKGGIKGAIKGLWIGKKTA
jgi:succinate dehydrogenase hydrophobic anchor subunit